MSSNTRKTDARSIDGCSDDLQEGPILLGETRLEVERKLELGNCSNHLFPVLSGSGGARARNVSCAEYVRSQIGAGHLPFRDVLEGWPVFGLDQNLPQQPFGDCLLPERGSVQKLTKPLRQSDLATSDFDRSLQGGNVRFIHTHPKYTTKVVSVNNLGRVPGNKPACIVLKMPAKQKKSVPSSSARTKRIRDAAIGPDGRTFGDRLNACMAMRARQLGLGDKGYKQADLIDDAMRAIGRDPERDEPLISQQGLSLILKNKVSESPSSVAFAMVFGVEPAWLQYGIGPQSYLERLLKAK